MSNLIKILGIFTVFSLMLVSCDKQPAATQPTDNAAIDDISLAKKVTIGSNAKSIGKVTVGTNASEWSSDTDADPNAGIYPIGGSGQLNGGFTIAEGKGIQIGLRIQQRFQGIYNPTGKRIGEYDLKQGLVQELVLYGIMIGI